MLITENIFKLNIDNMFMAQNIFAIIYHSSEDQ